MKQTHTQFCLSSSQWLITLPQHFHSTTGGVFMDVSEGKGQKNVIIMSTFAKMCFTVR